MTVVLSSPEGTCAVGDAPVVSPPPFQAVALGVAGVGKLIVYADRDFFQSSRHKETHWVVLFLPKVSLTTKFRVETFCPERAGTSSQTITCALEIVPFSSNPIEVQSESLDLNCLRTEFPEKFTGCVCLNTKWHFPPAMLPRFVSSMRGEGSWSHSECFVVEEQTSLQVLTSDRNRGW